MKKKTFNILSLRQSESVLITFFSQAVLSQIIATFYSNLHKAFQESDICRRPSNAFCGTPLNKCLFCMFWLSPAFLFHTAVEKVALGWSSVDETF